MQRRKLREALGNKALHFMLGALFAMIFSWPLFGFKNPFSTWVFMYGSWGVVVVLLAILSLSVDPVEDDDMDTDAGQEDDAVNGAAPGTSVGDVSHV